MTNPTMNTIPIRVPADAAGVYAKLVEHLRTAANTANDIGAGLSGAERLEWLRVRDAIRDAANRAYSAHQHNPAPRCRRCGVGCPGCSPPPLNAAARARIAAHVATITGHTTGCPCNACTDARLDAVEIEAGR